MAKYTLDEKLSAVTRYLEGVKSYVSIGRSIGTSESVVMNWVKQYQQHGEEDVPLSFIYLSTSSLNCAE